MTLLRHVEPVRVEQEDMPLSASFGEDWCRNRDDRRLLAVCLTQNQKPGVAVAIQLQHVLSVMMEHLLDFGG